MYCSPGLINLSAPYRINWVFFVSVCGQWARGLGLTILLINISPSQKQHQLWKTVAPKQLKL